MLPDLGEAHVNVAPRSLRMSLSTCIYPLDDAGDHRLRDNSGEMLLVLPSAKLILFNMRRPRDDHGRGGQANRQTPRSSIPIAASSWQGDTDRIPRRRGRWVAAKLLSTVRMYVHGVCTPYLRRSTYAKPLPVCQSLFRLIALVASPWTAVFLALAEPADPPS